MAWSKASMGGPLTTAVTYAIAIAVGVLHVFENHVYLLHLWRVPDTGLAQAGALQTENAFYYSYYDELVRSDSTWQGLEGMIWDRRSEYPDVLNALRRFNIYQEVVLALEYRLLRSFGLAFVDPWVFFRYNILVLNGVGHGALALLSSEISGNPLAGAACLVVSFLNRFQISRLGNYSSSNLRELWGIPLLWLQTWCLWRLLLSRSTGRGRALWWTFAAITFLFIVSWQFAPFLLLLQATAVYFVYLVCGYRNLQPTVSAVIDAYILALAAAIGVHFGSPYLLTSPFLFQLIALKASTSVCSCRSRGSPHKSSRGCLRACAGWALGRAGDVGEGLIAVAVFVAVQKAVAPFATADTHVYEILCTKVSAINDLLPKTLQLPQSRMPECAEPSFNARLYLVMGVFNLLERQSLKVYYDTLAGPAAALSCALVVLRCVCSTLSSCCCPSAAVASETPKSEEAGVKKKAPEGSAAADGGLRKRKGGKADASKPSQPHAAAEVPARSKRDGGSYSGDSMADDLHEEAALLFFVVQSVLFLLLGGLINRLRVAFGPPMMVLASSTFGPRLFPVRRRRWVTQGVLFVMFCLHMAWMIQKLPCISSEEGVCNHFSDKSSSDGDLADLCDWINDALEPSTPMLTSMNLAGSLRLFTGVPLVIHPQFESENLRKRVQLGYELYHCGSEESFADTMRQLHADLVVFEYARCFFTPYLLDDKRKNCDARKHAPEDQLCLKLHANPRLFKRVFSNGGYAVFRLRESPLPRREKLSSGAVASAIASREAWQEYVDDCARTQGELCGARLLETAATWEHSLKRKKVATVLRRLADKRYPEDGYVAYYLARYLDYDANQPQRALEYYNRAVKKLPNNPIIMKEYIMFLDMTLKDTKTLATLLRDRKEDKGKGRIPFLKMDGTGVGVLLCEASISAKNSPGLEKFGDQLWAKALRLAPLSDCVKNNWPLIHGEEESSNSYPAAHRDWDKVRMLVSGGVQHEVGSHNQPAVRFLGDRPFNLVPRRNGTR